MSSVAAPGPGELDVARCLAAAIECAWAAQDVFHATARGEVRAKAHAADLVTDVDLAVERAVRERLGAAFPDHSLVGEELGGTDTGGAVWWCDPVDGTTNLAAGLPWTSFSLALSVGRRPVVGVVADPWRGEVFAAAEGRGASVHRAGRPAAALRASAAGALGGQVVLTEWAAHEPWPGMAELLDALSGAACTSRVMGSGALALASVGAGRAAAAVIGAFQPIDHLAGVLIAAEAGAVVRDASGAQTRWPGAGPFRVAAPGVDAALGELLAR